MIPLGPAQPRPVMTGVFFDSKTRAGYWKAILKLGDRVQYIVIPNTSGETSQAEAEELAQQVIWLTS